MVRKRLVAKHVILKFQVLNEANLTNVVLVRSVLTRSDLTGALIQGADFSDVVLDYPQKLVKLDFTATLITTQQPKKKRQGRNTSRHQGITNTYYTQPYLFCLYSFVFMSFSRSKQST